jgi:hypothetical protein
VAAFTLLSTSGAPFQTTTVADDDVKAPKTRTRFTIDGSFARVEIVACKVVAGARDACAQRTYDRPAGG